MRKILLLVSACLFCLSEPGLASSGLFNAKIVIKLSRPNTSYAGFMSDRNACFTAAEHRDFDRLSSSVGAPGSAHPTVRYDLKEFSGCMNVKGYLYDPNGYRAAWYYAVGDNRYMLTPEPL